MSTPGRFYRKLGAIVAEHRKKHNLTQRDLARVIDRGRTSVANLERGTQPIAAFELAKLARELHVPVAALIPDA